MDFLQRMLETKNGRITELRKMIKEATEIEDVKRYGAEIENLEKEVSDIRNEITAREAENRSFEPAKTVTVEQVATTEERKSDNPLETMEYRTAFMDYVKNGTKSDLLQMRSSSGTSADLGSLGVVIPLTVMNSIMVELEKEYGSIYGKVKKTNLRGGVKYPIGAFNDVTFTRITETAYSSASPTYQHTGEVTGSIDFTYNIGEIRIERTLLERVLTVPAFEEEFAKVIARSYIRAMEREIIAGTPTVNNA